ncbi:MAG: lipoprotein insertase outer membrane protein LolB [Gammaproteobacteria bacterium]
MLTTASLAACATTGPVDTTIDAAQAWEQRQAKSYRLNNWRLDGKLGVQLQNEAWNVGLDWRQHFDDYRIEVRDLLGRKQAQLIGSPQGVSLQTGRNDSFQAADAETLMLDVLGWSLPLKGLRYWVLGVPDPDGIANRTEWDDVGRLRALEQSGWKVDYVRYAAESELPDRIALSAEGVKLKLVVRDWRLE